MRAATSSLAQVSGDERRQATLRRQGFVSQAVYDRTRAAVDEAQGRKTRAERSVELARNALDYATKADADGVVTATLVEPGQVIAAGQPAIRVARLDQKEAVVAIPEAQTARVGEAMAWLALWSKPSKGCRASSGIFAVDGCGDAHLRRALHARRYGRRRATPAVTGTLTLADGQGVRVAKLPLSALYNAGEGPALWLVDDQGGLKLAPVREVAAYKSDSVLIKSGVEDGARIVAMGVQNSTPANACAWWSAAHERRARKPPSGFNASAWAVAPSPLVLFFILALAIGGAICYLRLGQAKTRPSPSRWR